jgi:hypothetical protein
MSGRILATRRVPQVAADCGVLNRSEQAVSSERSVSCHFVCKETWIVQDKLNQSIVITFRLMMQMSLTWFLVWPELQLRYRQTLMKFKALNFLYANFKRGRNRQIT